jgi:predicted ArsR family transcriptional regulator
MNSAKPGKYAYEGLDRVFHEKARLAIMTCLASHRAGLLFGDLKQLCDLSDGNLNRHLDVLHEAGAVELQRTGAGRGSKTICKMTRAGQTAFTRYLDELERALQAAASAIKPVHNQSPPPQPVRLGNT